MFYGGMALFCGGPPPLSTRVLHVGKFFLKKNKQSKKNHKIKGDGSKEPKDIYLHAANLMTYKRGVNYCS